MNPNEPLPPETETTLPAAPDPRGKINWLLFWLALVAPTLLTMAVVLLGANRSDPAPSIAFVGGVISGIVCGVMLGRHIGQTGGARIVLGIIFSIVFAVVCVGMSCFGCLVSGYQINFH